MLHAQLINQFGGSDGVRDYNLQDNVREGMCRAVNTVRFFYAREEEVTSGQHSTVNRGLVSGTACYGHYGSFNEYL